MAPNTKRGTPGKAMLGFAAALAFAAVSSVRDRMERASREEWYFPTAIGDEEFFSDFGRLEAGSPVVAFNGGRLLMPEKRLISRADWAMEKAGRDDGDRHFVYRAKGVPAGEAQPGEDVYFLKVAGGEGGESLYVALQRPGEAPAP